MESLQTIQKTVCHHSLWCGVGKQARTGIPDAEQETTFIQRSRAGSSVEHCGYHHICADSGIAFPAVSSAGVCLVSDGLHHRRADGCAGRLAGKKNGDGQSVCRPAHLAQQADRSGGFPPAICSCGIGGHCVWLGSLPSGLVCCCRRMDDSPMPGRVLR